MAASDEGAGRTVDEVIAALQSAVGKGRKLGSLSLSGIGAGVDDAVRRLVDDRVSRALERPGRPLSETELTAVLTTGSGSSLARRIGSRSAGKLARRSRPLRALGGRSPAGLALRFGPALYDVVTQARHTMDVVATQLAARAAAAGVSPDPDRLRVAVVQILGGQPVDPGGAADHRIVARRWLTSAGGQLAPFGLGGRSAVPAADVAAAVQSVDPSGLAPDGGDTSR